MVMKPNARPRQTPSTASRRMAGERSMPFSPCCLASGTQARECGLNASSRPPASMLRPTAATARVGEMRRATTVAITGPSIITRLWNAVSTL